MPIEVQAATVARFDDVAAVLGPKNPTSSVCWCLSHRLDARTNRELVGPARGEYVRSLCARDTAPGGSLWCVRVRPGHRGKGIAVHLVEGAAEYARAKGAPAVEGFPVDNRGAKVDLTMAYVGTRALFERAGFTKVADTQAVSGGFPRVVVRRAL